MKKWVYKRDCRPPFKIDFWETTGRVWHGIDSSGLPRVLPIRYIFASKEDAVKVMVKDIKLKINELIGRIPLC